MGKIEGKVLDFTDLSIDSLIIETEPIPDGSEGGFMKYKVGPTKYFLHLTTGDKSARLEVSKDILETLMKLEFEGKEG